MMMMMMMIPVDQSAAALSFISSVARISQNPINENYDATVKVCHRKQIEAFAWSLSESIDAP
jgi:hypothetical protein